MARIDGRLDSDPSDDETDPSDGADARIDSGGAESTEPRGDGTGDRSAVPKTASLLGETLGYARDRDYRGPDYGDGMSSRLLDVLPVESTYLNLAVQETIKRAPVNLRPLFRVEARRNFKGTALFAMANMTAADLLDAGESRVAGAGRGSSADTGRGDPPEYRREARALADWLVDARIEGRAGYCGGHSHDLQTLDGVVEVGTPGIVGTAYAVKALLRADERFDRDYAGVARSAADFVFEDLNYGPADGVGATIDYKPGESDDYTTINAVALGARTLVDLYDRFRGSRTAEPRLREGARELLRYVAAQQTPAGGWHYRDPASASHLSMDNHHNGFVIEAFQRYRAVTGSSEFDDTLGYALGFYRDALFDADGAANFDEASPYPRDIHAATQGALVFAYAGDTGFARRILDRALETFYVGDGRYYFRKHRFHTKRVVLMRWCVAWMAYALAELERVERGWPDGGRPER